MGDISEMINAHEVVSALLARNPRAARVRLLKRLVLTRPRDLGAP